MIAPDRLEGPLRVIAGPGAGKTHALVSLYADLVAAGVPRSRILVLTFSTSAAGELARRVDERLQDSYQEASISTFHSFCARLLREHAPDPGRLLMSGFQEWIAMRRVLEEMDPGSLGALAVVRRSDAFAQDALGFVALLKQNLVHPGSFALLAETRGTGRLRALAAIYSAYQERLEESHLADFRDLVAGAIALLGSRPELRVAIQERFSHVLVDEFQDLDPAQFDLLRLIAPPAARPRLVVVGDPDQSIYGFRGSVPGLLSHEFVAAYGAETISLQGSHRCPPEILAAGERLLEKTQPGRPARHRPGPGETGGSAAVDLAGEADGASEAMAVARRIKDQLLEAGGEVRPADFAILLRSTSALAAPFEQALRALGIPCEVRGLGALVRNEVVRFLLAYLGALARPDDPEALAALLGSALSGTGGHVLGRLRAHATEEGRRLGKVVNRLMYLLAERDQARYPLPFGPLPAPSGERPASEGEQREPAYLQFLEDDELDRLHAAVTSYHRLRGEASHLSLAALAYSILEETGIFERLLGPGLPEPERAPRMAELRAALAAFEQADQAWRRLAGRPPRLEDFASSLEAIVARAVDETEPAPAERDAVQVLTVHQSKGLEFEVVFLAGFAEGVFPLLARVHPLLDEDDRAWLESALAGFRPSWPAGPEEHLAEEARLAYVGITRARRRLHVTFAAEYLAAAGPSPFLDAALPGVEAATGRGEAEVRPEEVLSVGEAETIAAAHAGALDERTAARLEGLGCDLAFITDPRSGEAFAPYLEGRPEGVAPHHFSATELTAYLKCPRIYWYSHHPRLVASPRTVEMARGGFLHRVLEDFHRREPEWRHLQLPEQRRWLEEAFAAHLEPYLAHHLEPALDRRREELEVRRLLANYLQFATTPQRVPRRGTLATEKRFVLEVDGAEIHGVIDRINDTGSGTCEVVDYKTGRGMTARRAYQAYFGEELYDVQLAVYHMACREGVGEDGEPLRLEPRFLSLWYPKELVYGSIRQVLFAAGEPAGLKPWMEQPLTAEDLERGRQTVAQAVAAIRGGHFEPRPRDVPGTCASFTGCPHQAVCPFARSAAD